MSGAEQPVPRRTNKMETNETENLPDHESGDHPVATSLGQMVKASETFRNKKEELDKSHEERMSELRKQLWSEDEINRKLKEQIQRLKNEIEEKERDGEERNRAIKSNKSKVSKEASELRKQHIAVKSELYVHRNFVKAVSDGLDDFRKGYEETPEGKDSSEHE